MSPIQPVPCGPFGVTIEGDCCPTVLDGYCTSSGDPLGLVITDGLLTGWIDLLTGIFTAGPPPAGTEACAATDVDIRPLDCSTDSITVCPTKVLATLISVVASTSSVNLLPVNANRKGAIFYNNSTANSWIKLGAIASSTSFTVRILSETFYHLDVGYTGIVDGIWLATNGAMRITEFT